MKKQPEGIYEVLDYQSTLELKDSKGKRAVFYKQQRVRFLQDNIIAYQDKAWGDGEIFADYKCAPGVAVDRYREGHRWRTLISLRETKNRRDVEEFHIERSIRDGFTKSVEEFQVDIDHVTRKLTLSVAFPRTRMPEEVSLIEQNADRTTDLGPYHRRVLPNGGVKMVWQTNSPRLFESYILRWKW
ncbi:hypothetical protein ACFLYO_01510 [Chloroflexota bacterium]